MNSWVIGLRPINVNYNKKEKLLLNRQELQRKVRQSGGIYGYFLSSLPKQA
jgi:hypothetical protein